MEHPLELGRNIYYLKVNEVYVDKIVSRSHIERLDGTEDWEYICNSTSFFSNEVDDYVYLSLSSLIEHMYLNDRRGETEVNMTIKDFQTNNFLI